MRRRIRAAALAAALLSAALVVTACGGRETEDSSTTEPTNRYDLVESSESELPVDLMLNFNIANINGKYRSDTLEAPYTGGEVTAEVQMSQAGVEELPVQFLTFLDGVLQPFCLDGGEEGQSHTITMPQGSENHTVSFTPGIVKPGEPVTLTIVGLFGFTEKLTADSFAYRAISPAVCLGFSVNLIADSSLEAKEGPDFAPEAPALTLGEIQYHLDTREGLEGQSSGYYFSYDPDTPEDFPEWFLPVSGEPGRHRTILLMDGEPVPAFGGEYYLDWESSTAEESYVFPLDLSFLPAEGSHNLYSVTIDLEMDLKSISRSICWGGEAVTVEAV